MHLSVPVRRLAGFVLAAILAGFTPLLAAPKVYISGTPASAAPALHGPGWDIGGGGTDVDAAMDWLVTYVGGGGKVDVVVLRCDDPGGSGSYAPAWGPSGGLISNIGACIEIVGTSASDFNTSTVASHINKAGVVFFAGGDQANYVNFIKGTSADTAVKNLIARGGGVGGTSAGTAIQGPFVMDSIAADAAGGTNMASADAMANPYESIISFTYNWYTWANFGSVYCEPHFGAPSDDAKNKDRMGRAMAMLARFVKDGKTSTAWGLCVNAGTSLCVDKNGLGTVWSTGNSGDGKVYMILLDHMPETCVSGSPLTCSNYKIWYRTAHQTFDLAHRPTCNYYLGSVSNGSLSGNYYAPGTLVTSCGPTITTQPASQTVSLGASATFHVAANNATSYLWQKNGTAISGATAASYTTPPTVSGDNGATFNVIVSNASGNTTSSSATLTIASSGAPTITTQPASQTVNVGASATFSVVASGAAPLTYQWMRNGSPISGATSSAYTTPATVAADHGAGFSVTVTNPSGGVTSATATLTVTSGGSELIANGGFESGSAGWTATSGVIGTGTSSEPAYAGSYRAYLGGRGRTYTDSCSQTVTIPAGANPTLSFYRHIDTAETTSSTQYDIITVAIRSTSGALLKTLATMSNLDRNTGYVRQSFGVTGYGGQTVQICFEIKEDSIHQTTFCIDNVSLK